MDVAGLNNCTCFAIVLLSMFAEVVGLQYSAQ